MNKLYKAFIIEDDPIMAECFERALLDKSCIEVFKFRNAFEAIAGLEENLPDLILLDVLLDGPDGFTFLNEIATYSDTSRIPIILLTSLPLQTSSLRHYGVTAVLRKDLMTPVSLIDAARLALRS